MDRISFSDRIGQTIIDCQNSPNAFVKKLGPKMLTLTLAASHLLDALFYMYKFSAKQFNTHSWKKIDTSDPEVSAYLKLTKQHLGVIGSSVTKSWSNPTNALTLFEQKMDLPKKGVTYQMMPLSRLGDNISCYLNAKWVAHKCGLPLVFKSFPLSEQLSLSHNQQYSIPSQFRCVRLGEQFSYEEFEKKKNEDILWEVPFFAQFDAKINWQDEEFRSSVIKDLSMMTTGILPPLVEGRMNVALHLRTGGTFDSKNETYFSPTKIPPREFFENALLILFEEYKDKPLHIQIFTDSTDIDQEVQRFTEFARKHHPNTTVASAERKGETDSIAVQDMVAMSRYDALIRADSGLSKTASLIGKPELEIAMPNSLCYKIKGKTIVLDRISIQKRDKNDNKEVTKETSEERPFDFSYDFPGSGRDLDHFFKHHCRLIGENNVKQ